MSCAENAQVPEPQVLSPYDRPLRAQDALLHEPGLRHAHPIWARKKKIRQTKKNAHPTNPNTFVDHAGGQCISSQQTRASCTMPPEPKLTLNQFFFQI